jgi:hypothetical protein
MSILKLIEKFEARLGTDDFILPGKLVEIGLFGSRVAVNNALKKGIFPSLKVSNNRTLIPRESVIEHLRNSLDGTADKG